MPRWVDLMMAATADPDIEKVPGDWVTITDIPIVGVGTYMLSTGKTTFTEDDLADAVRAANEDPSVKNPRLKLGHIDGSWQAGEPSFGNYTNLHLSADGQEIIADLETLDWLAEYLPIAYPNRSIEGRFGFVSEAGKSYRLGITAVVALGIELPGVSTLDDLREILTNPEVTMKVAAGKPGITVRAQIDAGDVEREFYTQFATGDRYWWWIRSVRLEPNALICEDEDTGQLWNVPFAISDRTITFSEPEAVYVEYKKDPVVDQAKASTGYGHKAAARSRAMRDKKESGVTDQELRASIGLPEDATDEQVKARLTELRAASEADPTDDPDKDDDKDDDADKDDDDTDADKDDDGGEGTPHEPTTTASVDRAALKDLKRDAAMGRKAREEQLAAADEKVISDAVRAGKFPPARRKHFEKLLAADREGTIKMIDDLEDGVVPVIEKGSTRMEDDEVNAGSQDAYPDDWLSPGERATRDRVRAAAQKGS